VGGAAQGDRVILVWELLRFPSGEPRPLPGTGMGVRPR
jgi:hypothetical protein